MVQNVGAPFGEDAVALRVGVGTEAEEDFAGVVSDAVSLRREEL
jgi:hypothetical protein